MDGHWSAKDALGGADWALYSARAMLHGKGHDVWEMIVENIPEPLEVRGGPSRFAMSA
jgi:hypothetical protein